MYIFTDLDDIDETNEDLVAMRKSLRHDKRLWFKVDKDGDGALTKNESRDFFFPEESSALKDLIVDVSSGTLNIF